MTTPKSNKERQRDHYNRKKAAGLKKVCEYVPASETRKLRDYAKALRTGKLSSEKERD